MKRIVANSFGRTIKHLSNDVCGFVSADRHERTPEENNKKDAELLAEIKASGLSYIRGIGHYLETRTDDDGIAQDVPVQEKSYCIINNKWLNDHFREFMVHLCNKYDQDSVMITYPPKNPDNEYDLTVTAEYLDKNGNITGKAKDVSTQDVGEFFTHYGSRKPGAGKDFKVNYQEIESCEHISSKPQGFVRGLTADTNFKNLYPELHRKVEAARKLRRIKE